MNSYAGILRFEKTASNPGADRNYFQKLSADFPSAFSVSPDFSSPAFSIIGNFESVANEKQELFLAGEIFNRDEMAAFINSPVSKFQHNAALLHAFISLKGMKAAKKINGQFVIIYLDKEHKKIFILNDHLGVQQIFYHQDKNIFLFGSEIKFLLPHPECPKEIDWETSLKCPLGFPGLGSYQSYKTWFKGISILPGATMLEIDLVTGKAKEKKYWNGLGNSNHAYEKDNRTAERVMEEYISLLENAVRIRTADEPTAYSLLSGGLDSSVICALAAKYKPLETFSVITQITCLEDTTTACNRLSNDLGFKNAQFLVPFHELSFNVKLWKQRIWRAESPLNHPDSLTKTLLHYAIRKNYPHVKYLLTGTGSDQFNGGLVRWLVSDMATKEESWESFFNEIVDAENSRLISRQDNSLWNMRKFIHRDFLAYTSGNGIENNPWIYYVKNCLDDIRYGLSWDEMHAASSHNHIMRFPFLDFRFAEFIAKIPMHLHKELFYDKPVLREPAKGILPDYIISKPKAPYQYPGYDINLSLFNFLTDTDELMMEAFGALDEPHPVINKKVLMNRIKQLRQQPEGIEWVYIMRIINLGLLEKLAGKNENDLNYEASLEEPVEIAFDNAAETKVFLEKRLAIMDKAELLNCVLQFATGCSFVFDKLNNKYFLSKQNTLVYEIEDEYTDWKNFLTQIDNTKTTRQILETQDIKFEAIEAFLNLSLKEHILITKDNPD